MKKEKVLLQSSIDGEPIWGYKEDVICVYVEDKNQSNNYCSNCGKQMWQHKTPKFNDENEALLTGWLFKQIETFLNK